MYTYERYNFRIITLLLGIMVIAFLAYNEYIGAIISLALGALLTWSYTGIRIDGVRQRFIRYDRFVKFRIGRWEKLPKPSYVTLVRINLSSERNQFNPMILPEAGKAAKVFKVNLVVEGDMRFITVCRGSLEKMKEEALKLGRELGVRVLDYTTHDKHWIL
ncbi:MAG: hypothetical protein V2B15_11295 [Bacteroidota bacterium]